MAKHVIYGDYECKNIRKLDGLQDPMVEIFLQEIKKLNWDRHQLWTHGSILGDSSANDIDLTIVGPKVQHVVSGLLEGCVMIGFNLNIKVDIKYLLKGELFDYTKDYERRNVEAHYRPEITIDGVTYKYAKLNEEGWWYTERNWPMTKSHQAPYPPKRLI